ncbi:hypothetical protein P5P86_14845 [Nocardioides sp. BP30]|uniref:hypothetical protein n=1 Tax=Nocardioides sp. BP30 TaxID=3036374 RepID=UPI002469ACB8|nr:hypothetical protein [Nocardioides sp. BP30]WGL51233.1 hypothetical protein P5P86_14845 [Nocardioides sp. BP30]
MLRSLRILSRSAPRARLPAWSAAVALGATVVLSPVAPPAAHAARALPPVGRLSAPVSTPVASPGASSDARTVAHPKAPKPKGVTKTLVVQLYWNGFPAADDSAALRSRILTGPAAWYHTVSHGRYGITGSVTRPIKVSPMACGESSRLKLRYERVGIKAAKRAGYGPRHYGRVVVALPCPIPKHSGFGQMPGKMIVLYEYRQPHITPPTAPAGTTLTTSTVSSSWWIFQDFTATWPDGYSDTVTGGGRFMAVDLTPIHEMGHNLGLDHAHLLQCRKHGVTTSFAGHCTSVEYGDDYDAMGSRFAPGSFSAPRLKKLHWLPGKVKHVHKRATVTLAPLEGASGTQAITVKGRNGRVYWIEYRTRTGVDAALDPAQTGVLIHYTKPHTAQTWLVDALPASGRAQNVDAHVVGLDDRDQAQLLPGHSLTTPEGITFTTVAQSGGAAIVRVSHHKHHKHRGHHKHQHHRL